MNTEKLNEAINNGRATEAKRQQPTPEPQQTSNQPSPFNVIDGAAKLVADKLQQPFNNAVIANLCAGLQQYVGEQINGVKPAEKDSSPNQVIEVFASSQIKSFGAGNMFYLSSNSTNSTTVHLPASDNSSNGNGKGFTSKN